MEEENTESEAYEEEGEEQLEEDVSVGEGKVLLQIIGSHFCVFCLEKQRRQNMEQRK